MNWQPQTKWQQIRTIEAHTAGEPLRVIVAGWPALPGKTIVAKRRLAQTEHDWLRRALMFEPRGHADMYGCILTEPTTPDGDVGVLFLHNAGFSTMCGHGIIALVTVGHTLGLLGVAAGDPVRIDTPAGRVTAVAEGRYSVSSIQYPENAPPEYRTPNTEYQISSVSFENVPSFVLMRDEIVTVPGLGDVRVDVAFGGAFYAFVEAADGEGGVGAEGFQRLVELGRVVKKAVSQALDITHPTEPDLSFLYGVIFTGAARNPANHSRNVCVFADGEVDRSPTGTGVSARAALHHARGDLPLGKTIVIESILGTTFSVSAEREVEFGGKTAVIPHVTGSAHIIGQAEWWIDPNDPLREGFFLR